MPGGAAQAVAVATGTADVQVYTGTTILRGWSFRESAGIAAVATLIIRDGTSAAGKIVAEVELAANASATEWCGDGIKIRDGIYVDRVAGETEGSVWHGTHAL